MAGYTLKWLRSDWELPCRPFGHFADPEELRCCCSPDKATFPTCHPVYIPHLFSPFWHIPRLHSVQRLYLWWVVQSRIWFLVHLRVNKRVCYLIFLHLWVRNPDYLLLETIKTRMCWGTSFVSGTRNIAGCWPSFPSEWGRRWWYFPGASSCGRY